MTSSDYKHIAGLLPDQPGVYRFIDQEGKLLYVGKAKHLKKRIASYFGNKLKQANRTRIMVKNAVNIEYTAVESEQDALLLENNLIKEHQPRYNVNLKDGKTYPFIVIKNERFPRVFVTRKLIRDGSMYFGPYTSKFRIDIILDLISKLFQLRTCNYNLSEENVSQGKFRVCLEYHINNCKGPCIGLEPEEEYNDKIAQVKNILKGNFTAVKQHIRQQMEQLANNMEYEKAQLYKVRLDALQQYQIKSTVVSSRITDADIFSLATDEHFAYINFLRIVKGAIINDHTLQLKKNLNQHPKDLLVFGITALRETFNSDAPEVIVPYRIILPTEEEIKITVPKRGEKRKLIEMSEQNARLTMLQKQKQALERMNKQQPHERILRQLQNDLNMQSLPLHIECFDNSNFQGSYPASSCVVFRQAKPAKQDYRHYNVKTVAGPDDFASMEEVVFRRYHRLKEESKPMPDLVIVDGGKGQLSAAVKSLRKLDLYPGIIIIGIAKRLEEIYFPGDPIPLFINKKSESLKLIQQLRDEAHRFALRHHRNKRSLGLIKTELTDIPTVGAKKAARLLEHFGSVQKIAAAGVTTIAEQVGLTSAKEIHNYFTSSKDGNNV